VRRTLLPSVEIEKEIDALLAGERVDVHPLEVVSELGRLGVRLVLQRAVEEEVDEWLGRARYERRPEAAPRQAQRLPAAQAEDGRRRGRRRGAAGARGLRAVHEQALPAAQALLGDRAAAGAGDRRLRPRPVDARRRIALRGSRPRAGLEVDRLEAVPQAQGALRRLPRARPSAVRLVCLLLDAIFLPVRPSGAKEGVLCAWGISEEGERVLLDVCLGMREAEEDWLELGRSLTRRGLPSPLLVVADGAPGLVAAIEQLWPHADRQRCTVHRLRNVLAKLPEAERERVKAAYWRALDEASSQQDGERRLRALIGELADQGYSAAAACLADDLEALTVHLRYPLKHRRVWRSTNLLERSLGEVKRRTKVIGRFPGETSCLSLSWAVLDLVIAGANRVRFDDLDRQLIQRIAAEHQRSDEDEEVIAA
jgi:putative transposase